MLLEFLNYIEVLNIFLIPDLSNIIISYISHYVEMFDENFISECIKTGHYLYYNKNYTTLVHYLFEKKRLDDIKNLFINSKYLKAEHFQNKNMNGETELYWLCYEEMHSTIALASHNFVDGFNEDKVFDNVQSPFWKPEHFQNKNKYGKTELYWLCHNKMYKTITLITSNFVGENCWKPKHFQNKNKDGRTELYWICYTEMHKTITLVTSNFVDGDFWKPEHFQNKNKKGETELA